MEKGKTAPSRVANSSRRINNTYGIPYWSFAFDHSGSLYLDLSHNVKNKDRYFGKPYPNALPAVVSFGYYYLNGIRNNETYGSKGEPLIHPKELFTGDLTTGYLGDFNAGDVIGIWVQTKGGLGVGDVPGIYTSTYTSLGPRGIGSGPWLGNMSMANNAMYGIAISDELKDGHYYHNAYFYYSTKFIEKSTSLPSTLTALAIDGCTFLGNKMKNALKA